MLVWTLSTWLVMAMTWSVRHRPRYQRGDHAQDKPKLSFPKIHRCGFTAAAAATTASWQTGSCRVSCSRSQSAQSAPALKKPTVDPHQPQAPLLICTTQLFKKKHSTASVHPDLVVASCGDVPHPGQCLVTTLLDDLEVAHLRKRSSRV